LTQHSNYEWKSEWEDSRDSKWLVYRDGNHVARTEILDSLGGEVTVVVHASIGSTTRGNEQEKKTAPVKSVLTHIICGWLVWCVFLVVVGIL
jgi:hypothetical protein